MKGNTKMELLNLFKRKKIKSGVCFSNQKSVDKEEEKNEDMILR